MTQLLLVRHGQSTWNADGRWQGHADPPLSALGERQALAAVPHVADVDTVWSSDLVRAARTAELLAPSDVEVRLDPRLRERNAGKWTGLTRAEIEEQYPGYLESRTSAPGFEGDEPLLERAIAALHDIAASGDAGAGAGAGADANVLVVTHGGVIRALERWLGAPPEPVANLGGRVVEVGNGQVVLGERRLLIDPGDVAVTVPRQI